MKDKILLLCKRLNKFTINELVTITETKQDIIQKIIDELVNDDKIYKDGDNYCYRKLIGTNNNKTCLPVMFQYHSNQEIDFIIKGFCSDIEVKKMINVFGIGKFVMDRFYSYLRTRLYDKQMTELLNHFEKEPKIGQEREYMTAKVYLYLYDDKLFVSEKLLKSNKAKKHTEEERLTIKNIYLRSYRKVLSRAYTHKFHLHLSEELWKWGKEFKTQYKLLNKILYS